MDDLGMRDIAAQGATAGGLGVLGRLIALAHAGSTRPSGVSLLWEIPLALGMGVIGKGVADWFGLDAFPEYAVTIAVSYSGPRLLDIAIARWLTSRGV